MLSPVAPPLPAFLRPASSPEPFEVHFLDHLGLHPGSHVLVLGERRAEMMAALIRHGCLAATSLRQHKKPVAGGFDTVIVPSVAPGCDLDDIVHCAWRGLAPGGTFVACLADAPALTPGLELTRRLRLHGFGALRARPLGGQWVLRAGLLGSNAGVRHG